MKLLMGLLFWMAVIYGAIALIRKMKGATREEIDAAWPVKAKKTLLNQQEQIVFNRLTEAFPDWIVLAQVALSQVIYVTGKDQRTTYRNKIDRKVIDFIVCKQDTSVVAAIELDGNSHDAPMRTKSDIDKQKALDSAGLKLIRLNTKALPNGNELRSMVEPQQQITRMAD